MKKLILLLFLFPVLSLAQTAIRVDVPIQTTGPNVPVSGGPLPQALWVANATVNICTHPSATLAACQASPITTYTDSTQTTPCDTATPLVPLPGNTCVASSGSAATLGFWYAGGTVDYYVTSTYGTFGPYTISGASAGGGVTPSTTGLTAYYNSTGAIINGNPPANCAAFPDVPTCMATATAALIPPGTTGAYTQNNAQPASLTCFIDNTTGQITLEPLGFGIGYTVGSTPAVTTSTLPVGASLGTITGNAANSQGQITGYTISGANSFPATGTATTGCPITFTVTAPPVVPTPIAVTDYNRGTTTLGPVVRLDDFGCKADGVTDDTQCFNNAAAFVTGNGARRGTVSATGGKTYKFASVTGFYRAGFDDGIAPIAAQLAITVTGSSMTGCSVTTPGQFLATSTVIRPGGVTGGTITPVLNTSSHTITSCTASGSTTAGGNFTATAGPLCQGSLCTTLAPIANYIPFSGQLQNNLTIQGNGATFSGGFLSGNNLGACVHITAWSVSGSTATFTYSSPRCTLTAGEQLVLEGFPTTQTFNGQTVTVNIGVTSGSFSATVAGSATENGAASTFANTYPNVALLGFTSSGGASGVQISNLFFTNGFICLGNWGSGNVLTAAIPSNCQIFVQGQNAQNDKISLAGNSTARANVGAGLVLGGAMASRAPSTGVNTVSVVNGFDLFDGMVFSNSEFFYTRSVLGTVAQQNEVRQGLNCWFDQYFLMLEATGTPNPENCWNPPGGVVRMTDQDFNALPYTDFMWRGIFGIGFAGYTVYGRPTNGVDIESFFNENEPSYSVVIGPNNNGLIINGVFEELEGLCADNSTKYGSVACPNPFEPQYPVLNAAVLTNSAGNYSQLQTQTPESIARPWQTLPTMQNYVYNIVDGLALENSFPAYTGASGNAMRAANVINSGTQSQSMGTLIQADGAQLNTGSQIISLPNNLYNGAAFATTSWNMGDISQLYAPSPNQSHTLYVSDQAFNGTTLLPSTVLMNGLRVNTKGPQGGGLNVVTVTSGGTGYPANVPVPVAVSPSQANTPGSATAFYLPQCGGTSNAGVVKSISCGLIGAGYTSAPTMTVAPPGAGVFSCTSVAGVPAVNCKLLNAGIGITSCSTLDTSTSGTGIAYSPVCTGGIATSMSTTGGTGYPNFWYVFVGTNGGTQATATVTVTPVDPQAQIEHLEKCAVNSASSVTVAAGTTSTLAGLTGTCSNLIFVSTSTREDYLQVLAIPGFNAYGGMYVYATPTSAGTISISMSNNTNASVTVPAGNYTLALVGANSFNDMTFPSAVTPTITSVNNFGGSLPSGTTNQLLYYATSGTTLTPLTLGTNLSITTGVLNASSTAATNFNALTSGTNTAAAMVVGTGASLAATGSGSIHATTSDAAPFSGISAGTNNAGALVVGLGSSLSASGGGTIAATTATALASTPTLCSAGQAPTGVLANGNATGCASTGGSGTVTHTGSLTAGQIVIGNGTADVTIDTGASTDGAGNVAASSYATNGVTNGNINLTSTGTPASAPPVNTVQITVPSSVTAYSFSWPSAAPASSGQMLTATTGGVGSWTSPAVTSLTTTGSSGAATLIAGVLNIPNYAGGSSLPSGTTGQGLYYATGGTTVTATSDIIHTGAAANANIGFNVAVPLNEFDFAGSVGFLGTGPTSDTTSNGAFTSGATTFTVVSTTGYPSSGILLIGASNFSPEFLSYTGTSGGNTFTGLTRSLYGTTAAASQATGMTVVLVEHIMADSTTATPKWVCFWKGDCMYAPTNNNLISSSITNPAALGVGGTLYANLLVVGGNSGGAGIQASGTNGLGFFNTSSTTIGSINSTGTLTTTGNSTTLTSPTSITSLTLVTTGLVMPTVPSVTGSVTYRGRCSIIWEQSTGVNTVTLGIGASAAPTDLYVMNTIHYGLLGVTSNDLYTTITSNTATNISQSVAPGATGSGYKDEIDFTLVNPTTTANTITIYGLTGNASDALVIEPGSSCEWLP